MKRIFISIFIILTLTGCWNCKELNDYSIITGIAIDKSSEGYEVSAVISNSQKNSSESSSQEPQIVVYSGKGESIVESLKNLGLIAPKELYLGSFSILIISEDLARDGIENVVDFFLRFSNTGKNFYIIVTRDNKAKNALKIMSPLTNHPSQTISDNLNSTSKLQGFVSTINFNELITTFMRKNVEPVINSIEIIGEVEKGESKENLEVSEPKSYTKLGPFAIFKDNKLVDWATHEESIGINLINNKINEMYINIKTDEGYVTVDTTDLKSKVKTKVNNNTPEVLIEINSEAKIIEASGKINLEDYKVIKDLQNKVNKKVNEYINMAISLAIKNKSDIFGFGYKFYQNYPKYYKTVSSDWENSLDKIKVDVNSNIVLKNSVSAKNSLEEIHDK